MDAGIQIGQRLAAVDQRRRADQIPVVRRLEVVDLDLHRGAKFAYSQGRLHRGAHADIGQRKDHGTVHHLVRIQVFFIDREHALAVARTLFEVVQVDQFGEGVVAHEW